MRENGIVGELRRFAVETRVAFANFVLRIPIQRLRNLSARTLMRWVVGCDVVIGRWTFVSDLGGIEIGDNTNIGYHSHLDGRGKIKIGSYVDMAPFVTIHSGDHDPNDPDHGTRYRPTTIGDRVWLCTGATVMSGAVLKDGVVLGAKAVAFGVLEENGIYAGNPAKLIKHRDPGGQKNLKPYRRYWI
ncbi:acyltransferase [Rhodococcus sp. IEGM 1370]|uniref:acyltransferase n=1 Tax=Rhodococcus sp. IEGM 1370 TaxID=3082222 RepID=UPI0029543FAC|nr:acyltransferase [Rhodococcus sp. IEGM 1370]MDV8077535.1 acyltransferase [Rhodococcus sp. IEGM 1370]